ncbi:MAG: PAS domain S-box protein [Pseudomonadota bacterium]
MSGNHETENFLELTEKIAQSGSFRRDLNTGDTVWSTGMFRIFGIAPGSVPPDFEFIVERIHPDDKAAVINANESLRSGGREMDIEYRIIRSDGEVRHIHSRAEVRADESGDFCVKYGVLQDVTDFKRTAAALQFSELRFRTAFQTSPDAVNINRLADGLYIDINDGFTDLTGFTRADVTGKTSLDIDIWDAPADRDRLVAGLKKEGVVRNLEARFRRKDGSTTTALMSARVMTLNNAPHILSVTRDISHLKRAEQALLESERKYRRIFESLSDVYFETTLDGAIVNTSPSAETVSGHPVHTLIGNRVDMLYHNPADRQPLLEALRRNGRVRNFEVVFKRNDGTPYDVSINADVYCDENGRPAGMTGTIRDVTEQKKLKEQLQRSRKMESFGLMAGGIAHDLNNILSGIVSYPDLLLMDMPEDSPLRKPIQTIKRSGERAAGIVADLLTVARGVAVGKEVFNINDIIGEYLNSNVFKTLEKAHPGVSVHRALDPALLNTRCSPIHMQKILMNLISNAAEAIAGNGTVTIETTNIYIDLPLKGDEAVPAGEYVRLRVSDTGNGISREDIDRIFEPFYTKRILGRSGTGLGLSVVWNAVHDHDGTIHVDSGKDGTAFTIYFPVTREAVTQSSDSVPIETYRGGGEKILVVDDEEDQREIACEMLLRLGYAAESVPSGEEAVDYLREKHADLLLLDMIMVPNLSGRETYEKVIKAHPGQKAILASGFAETIDVRAAQKAGAGAFIKKPYTIDKLGITVKLELEKTR